MNADIVREVATTLATHEKIDTTGWKWRPGVVLFPETRCPFCKDVIKSKAVWLVEGNYLKGQAVPVAGRPLVLDPPKHPHALPSQICMGNATDPLQALFNGLNPESSFFNVNNTITGDIPGWLRGPYWKHDCDKARNAEERALESEEDDHEEEFYCGGCDQYFSDDESNEYRDNSYCNSCFSERAFRCANCDITYSNEDSRTAFNDLYCNDCFDDKFFTCVLCGDVRRDHEEVASNDDGSICRDCSLECEDCQQHFDPEKKFYCVYCIRTVCPDCESDHDECGKFECADCLEDKLLEERAIHTTDGDICQSCLDLRSAPSEEEPA